MNSHTQIKSIDPHVLKIKTNDIHLGKIKPPAKTSSLHRNCSAQSTGSTETRPSPFEGVQTSRRNPKRKNYVDELEDMDYDNLMNISEDEAMEQRRLKLIAKKSQKKACPSVVDEELKARSDVLTKKW